MAVSYGNVVQHWQAICGAYIIATTDTTVTVRCDCYFHSIGWGYNVYGNGTATVNGQSANSGRVTCYSPTGGSVNQALVTKDVTVPRGNNDYNISCSAVTQLTGGYHNGTSSASVSVTIPAIPSYRPDAPNLTSATRNSDSSISLKWQNKNNDGARKYYRGILVRHWENYDAPAKSDDAKNYVDLYNGGVISSYTDTKVKADSRYIFCIYARWDGGWSDWSNRVTVYTTPAKPASATISKPSNSSVKIAWGSGGKWANGKNIQYSLDGGKTWKDPGSLTWSSGYAVDSNPPQGNVKYRVRNYRTGAVNGSGTLYSSWVETGTVTTVYQPSAPSGVSVTRVSDTQHKLAWTNNADSSARKPYTGINVYKRMDGGSWTLVYSGAVIANYTDSATLAGHKYEYKVRAKWLNGESGDSNIATAYTTPLAPTSLYLGKTDYTLLNVSVTEPTTYASGIGVEVTEDNGATWTQIVGDGKTGWTISGTAWKRDYQNPPAGTVRIRARGLYGSLASAWVESDSIVTICPPFAPNVSTDANVYPTGSNATVTWRPNHPDGTAQSAAQVELTDVSGTSIYDIDGAGTIYTVEDMANGDYRARVRTKGIDEDWGEWSGYAAWSVATAPVVTIASPAKAAVIDALPLSVEWDASDETGIQWQRVQVYNADGKRIHTVELDGDVRSTSLDSEVGFVNDGSYSLSVTVCAGTALKEVATVAFTTDWAIPDEPTVTIENTEDGHALITCKSPTTDPAIVRFDIVRVLNGERLVIATGLESGQSCIDRLPPLNTEYSYEVTGWTRLGEVRVDDIKNTFKCDGVYFNFGAGAVNSIKLGLNAKISRSFNASGETFHFALGADQPDLPVFYPDGDIDVTGSHSFVIYRKEGFLKLRALLEDPANSVCWYRGPYGERAFVYATWQTSYSASSYELFEVSTSLTECVWEEPVNG